jgi:hypothetical protein
MDVVVDYSLVLNTEKDGLVFRDLSLCDDNFARLLAQSLLAMRLGSKVSNKIDEISVRIQGNLCEFFVWELGENHWEIYKKSNTAVANANSPFIGISRPGIDIVAFDDDGKTIYILEVKSSQSDGINLIFNSASSLKADYQHLFEIGPAEERIWGSINELIADLCHQGRKDIAENIKNNVGNKPENCKGVKLIGVLVCQRGDIDSTSNDNRKKAFNNLDSWLVNQGWRSEQCEYRTVEVTNFEKWLRNFIDQVTE